MKKHINEPDFIGGQGPLTKEEELALTQYFANKKIKERKQPIIGKLKAKSRKKVSVD